MTASRLAAKAVTTSLLVFLLTRLAGQARADDGPQLFEIVPGVPAAARSTRDTFLKDPDVLSISFVKTTPSALKAMPPTIKLTLTPNVTVTASVNPSLASRWLTASSVPAALNSSNNVVGGPKAAKEASRLYAGAPVWVGEVNGYPGPQSHVILSANRNLTSGYVRYVNLTAGTTSTFLITPVPGAGQLHMVREVKEKEIMSQGPRPVPEGMRNATTALSKNATQLSSSGRRLLQNSPVNLDLLVVMTTSAINHAGGFDRLLDRVRQDIALANKAYADSNIRVQINIAGWRHTTQYSEGSRTLSEMLDALTYGQIPTVASWRSETGADLVVLYANPRPSNTCGIGWVWSRSSSYAFSAVAVSCSPSFTLAHEIGHNLGCGHNKGDRPSGEYASYSWGWRRCSSSGSFRTILSYTCPNANTPRIGLFSNPSLSVNGVPAGHASDGDCARTVRATAATLASFQNSRYTVFSGLRAIRSGRTGQLCSDDPNGIQCNRDVLQSWEAFQFQSLGNNQVALMGGRGKYCSDTDGGIVCDRTSVGAWERFTLVDLGTGRWALRGGRNNQFCADDSRNRVDCNRVTSGAWESFQIFAV